MLTCQKHAPSDNGVEEDAGLRNKLEGTTEMEQGENILHKKARQ